MLFLSISVFPFFITFTRKMKASMFKIKLWMKILSWDLYFTSILSNQLNVFWKVWCLCKRFRVATFLFAENAPTISQPVKVSIPGKITSKISATIGCINKPCSVLSAPFDLNGNSNIWLCYSYWKNIFVNCNNIIFRLWSFFGIRMSAS